MGSNFDYGADHKMSESASNLFDLLLDQIRQIVREEIAMAIQNARLPGNQQGALLTAKRAAALMGVTPRWLYRNARKLPFARYIGRKTLRFSQTGLNRWLAVKSRDSRR